MRRDPKIQKILPTDSQNALVDKINSNFVGLHYLQGGNLGSRGATGATGQIGLPGDQGPTGNQGIRGTRWFVGDSSPQGGPGNVMVNGDYWIDTFGSTSLLKKFSELGWVETGINLSSNSQFGRLENIENISGATAASAIFYKNLNESTTFNFSDTTLGQMNSNPLHSMFLISTDSEISGENSLLEFSRGDLSDGTPSDYLSHPRISFTNPSDNNSDITFLAPNSKLNIQTLDVSDSVRHDMIFNVNGEVNVRASSGFTFGTSSNSPDPFQITSGGSFLMSSPDGFYKPSYRNIEHDIASSNRIQLNNSLDIDSQGNPNFPAIRVSSKIDTVQEGSGTLEVSLGGGSFTKGLLGYKPENYLLKIETLEDEIKEDKFSISSAGSIYFPKESNGFTLVNELSDNTNSNFGQSRTWYLFGNIDYIEPVSSKKTSFANDKNEIIINPSGIPDDSMFGVGLQLNITDGISYLNNLKNIGETLKFTIRSASTSRKIDSFGVTLVAPFNSFVFNDYTAPRTYVHDFPNGTNFVEVTIIKQVSGHLADGDLIHFKSSDGCGFFTTQN